MSTPTPSHAFPEPEDQKQQEHGGTPALNVATIEVEETTASMENVGAASIPGMAVPLPMRGALRDVWRLISMNRKVSVGLSIVGIFLFLAIFGPLFTHHDPNALIGDSLAPPSADYWLGTTQTGQDVFAQLMYGTRSSVLWGFFTGIVVTLISVSVGLIAGYMGGIVDEIISLLINIFLLIPGFPLAVVLASLLPFRGLVTVSLVLVVTGWSFNARVLRAQTMTLRNRDFAQAARMTGEHPLRIIFFEILPNEISLVVVGTMGTIIYAIVAAAGLEFLGLGRSTDISWGTMLYWAQNNDALFLGAWWWIIPPGLCIALLAAALSLVNFGVDEVANPRLRNERPPKKSKVVVQ